MADKVENPLTKRDFSKVIITLDNVMVPGDKMETTPSLQDGLSIETEMDLRILGCELIQTAGILLKLPQVAMASGQVLFQRFYYSKSFVKHDMEVVAMACINLASKIEEAPRRIRDVVNVIHHIKQVKNGKTISPLILDQKYINTKNAVIKAERRVLKELGFCVHVKHPHKIIVMFLKVLECDRNARLVQCAWNYMNDSFRTNVFMEYPPETIACTCIYLAARKLQIVLPNNPPWYELFDVEEDHLKDISVRIIKLYSRKKANPEALEKIVNEVKKIHVEAKLKAKGMTSENATPNSSSRPSSPTSKVSPTPLALSVKRIKEEDDRSDSSGYRHGSKKKRSRSRSDHSRSRSRSKSKSYSSRSRSYSPVNRRHKNHSPQKKYKKESNKDYDGRDKHHSRKRHRSPSFPHSQSRSYSRSPEVRNTKNKKYHRERYRSRSRSPSYDRYQTKSKYRSHSRSPQRPSRVQHKSKKHNGHRRSRSRDRYRR